MLYEKDSDVLVTVRKLVMISLMELFKDIVPGYHIRLPTEKEQKQKVNYTVYHTVLIFGTLCDINKIVETWPLTKMNMQSLQRNDRAMIRQICSIKPEDVSMVSSSKLLAKLEFEDLYLILRERRLRWFEHVERSSGAVRTACDIQIDCWQVAERPKVTWKKLTEKDCSEWKLTTVDPQERSTWRSGARSAILAASQLPGRGSTDVDDAPAPAG